MENIKTYEAKLLQENLPLEEYERNMIGYSILELREPYLKYEKEQHAFMDEYYTESRNELISDVAAGSSNKFEGFNQMEALDLSKQPENRETKFFSSLSNSLDLSYNNPYQMYSSSNINQSTIPNISKSCDYIYSEELMIRRMKVTESAFYERRFQPICIPKVSSKKLICSQEFEPLNFYYEPKLAPLENCLIDKEFAQTLTSLKQLTIKEQYPSDQNIESKSDSQNERHNFEMDNKKSSSMYQRSRDVFSTENDEFSDREIENIYFQENPPFLTKYNEKCALEDLKYDYSDPPILKKYYEDPTIEEMASNTEYLKATVLSKGAVENLPRTYTTIENIQQEHSTAEFNINSFIEQFQTSMAINFKRNKLDFEKGTAVVSPLVLKECQLKKLSSKMTSAYGSISSSQNSSSVTEKLTEAVTWVNFRYNFNFESDESAIYIRDINNRFLPDNSLTQSVHLRPYFTIIGNANEGDDEEFCMEEILSILYYYRREFFTNDPRLQERSFVTILPVMPISCRITPDNDYELVGDNLMKMNERQY